MFAARVEHTAAVLNLPAGLVMCLSSDQDRSRSIEGSRRAILKMTETLKACCIIL